MVVLAAFARVKPPAPRGVSRYEADYQLHGKLYALAQRFGLAIVSVTQFRKGSAGGDLLEAVTGSTGITDCADSIRALKCERG